MSARTALRIEVGVIGLGIVALLLIFQPLSLALFPIGCGLVVLAALVNNLLPVARPGEPLRSVFFAASVVAVIFCTALLLAITAAYGYGVVFLKAPPAGTSLRPPAPPFWEHPLVWGLLAVDAVFVFFVYLTSRRS